MTFVLLDKIQSSKTKELNGTTQVASASSRPVVITDEGHVLLPGQVAAVNADDKTLAKALEKGLVAGVGYSHPGIEGSKQTKRSASTIPKGQTTSEGSVARGKTK